MGRSPTGPSWRYLVSTTDFLLLCIKKKKKKMQIAGGTQTSYLQRAALHVVVTLSLRLSPLQHAGRVRSLSSSLWTLTHLTALHINDNNLTRIPPDIAKLPNLVYLNLSSNKLRSLPAELGNMVSLRWDNTTFYTDIVAQMMALFTNVLNSLEVRKEDRELC